MDDNEIISHGDFLKGKKNAYVLYEKEKNKQSSEFELHHNCHENGNRKINNDYIKEENICAEIVLK